MIKRSVATWENASGGKVEFVFQGLTDRIPMRGDGYTDLGYGHSVRYEVQDDYIVEADIEWHPLASADWDPCEQRDNSCTPTGKHRWDAQALITHELGHVLGLRDVVHDEERELTMYSLGDNYNGPRFQATLGLGDVRGLRDLYPCSCPLPRIYRP